MPKDETYAQRLGLRMAVVYEAGYLEAALNHSMGLDRDQVRAMLNRLNAALDEAGAP